MDNSSEVREFYNMVLRSSTYFLSTKNKFKISWTAFDSAYNPTCKAGADYKFLSSEILREMNYFRLYVDSVNVPGLSISKGGVVDEGMGVYYYSGNGMLQPEDNRINVYFRESQFSVVDFANVWMAFNGRPWVRPIRLNLNIDYYSDIDGKTPIMAYQISGCTPVEADNIEAKHDRKEILIRKIEFGFNSIKPISVDGQNSVENAIRVNLSMVQAVGSTNRQK